MKTGLAAMLCLPWLALASAAASVSAVEPGQLLVARGGFPDVRFRDAVVLVVQQGPGGTAGLILNRPSRLPVADVLPGLPVLEGPERVISYGGPVVPRKLSVLVATTGPPPDPAQKILDSIYLTGPEQLAAWLAAERPNTKWRIFAGYAGWAPGQLDGELARDDWRVLPAEGGVLFPEDSSGMWRDLAGHCGSEPSGVP